MKIQNINRRKLAFSLIELSVVILVIGILVIGITKGGSIIEKARLGSAKSLTNSAPVAVIPNLIAWYETTLDTSLADADEYDGETLTGSWYDNSPSGTNDAAISVAPDYDESEINSLPTIKFAANDIMTFNALPLNQKYYTIFIVEKRSAATGDILNIGGTDIDYSASTTLGDSNTVGQYTVAAYDANKKIARISTFISDSDSKRVYVNGGTAGGTTGTAGLTTATASGTIGKASTGYAGDIAEIIIYNRALKDSEVNDINEYLGKKFNITTSDIS